MANSAWACAQAWLAARVQIGIAVDHEQPQPADAAQDRALYVRSARTCQKPGSAGAPELLLP
jgi:hypothetical protein